MFYSEEVPELSEFLNNTWGKKMVFISQEL